MMNEKIIHKIKFVDATFNDVLCFIETHIAAHKKAVIFTPNSLMIMECQRNKKFLDIINASDINVPDGQGIIWASKLLKKPLKQKIAGVELAQKLLETMNNNKNRLFILGGEKDSSKNAVINIREKYKDIICEGLDGYFTDESIVIDKINSYKADVVYICLGSPKQEIFINNNIEKFNKGIFIGLGGTVDIISGKKKRAPKLIIALSLEWLWRAVIEPKRFCKLAELPRFVYITIKERLKNKNES